MRTIYKYQFTITDEQQVNLPRGCKILHVGLDPTGKPCLWAEVDTDAKIFPTTIRIFGTGHTMPEDAIAHLGSFIQGMFVWHVYIG